MKIKSLEIRNIRNIEEVTLPCDRGIHFIYGLNGQGKTSILESIYLLSNLKSFRDSDLSALLQSDKEMGKVKGSFNVDGQTEGELKVELIKGLNRFEKRAYINQKLARSTLDYYGVKKNHSILQFHAINLNPTSTDLMRSEPGFRRNYLNQIISSENPNYLDVLKRYQKTIDQKNALLKEDGVFDEHLLKILNENMIKLGAELIHARLTYLEKIAIPVSQFLSNIAPHQKKVNLAYKIGETLYFNGHFLVPSIQILMENLHQKLIEKGPLERVRKTSLVGPHRDDLVFKVGEQKSILDPDLVNVGSQGEIRSVLLALKLTELEEFEKTTGIRPVLLIDDFSSELDSTRRGFLLDYLRNSELQIFVTSTDDPSLNLGFNGTTIQLNQGRVV